MKKKDGSLEPRKKSQQKTKKELWKIKIMPNEKWALKPEILSLLWKW